MAAPMDPAMIAAIQETARELGIDPRDLATAIAYETGGTFDPWQQGPETRHGQHAGLIQWGEPQREQYGVSRDMSVADQMRAAGQYMRDNGVRPGANFFDIYSAINAGQAGRNAREPTTGRTTIQNASRAQQQYGNTWQMATMAPPLPRSKPDMTAPAAMALAPVAPRAPAFDEIDELLAGKRGELNPIVDVLTDVNRNGGRDISPGEFGGRFDSRPDPFAEYIDSLSAREPVAEPSQPQAWEDTWNPPDPRDNTSFGTKFDGDQPAQGHFDPYTDSLASRSAVDSWAGGKDQSSMPMAPPSSQNFNERFGGPATAAPSGRTYATVPQMPSPWAFDELTIGAGRASRTGPFPTTPAPAPAPVRAPAPAFAPIPVAKPVRTAPPAYVAPAAPAGVPAAGGPSPSQQGGIPSWAPSGLSNASFTAANFDPVGGGSQFDYVTGQGSDGGNITSYQDDSGGVHTFSTDVDGYAFTDEYSPSYSDSVAGASGGGTVFCTHFMRAGRISRRVWLGDMRYSASLPRETYAGYRAWADPLLAIVENGRFTGRVVEAIMWPIVSAWSREAAYRAGYLPAGSVFGKFVHATLGRVSNWIGKRLTKRGLGRGTVST